jgi:hypothetical protein
VNFFEHQALARRNSRVMVLLFAVSVIAIIIAVNAVAALIYVVAMDDPAVTLRSVPRALWVITSAVTFGVIFIVSLVNIIGLAGGGAKVAQMMGGRAVASNATDRLGRAHAAGLHHGQGAGHQRLRRRLERVRRGGRGDARRARGPDP